MKENKIAHNRQSPAEIQRSLDNGINLNAPYKISFVKREQGESKNLKGFFRCGEHGDISQLKTISNHTRKVRPTNPCPQCQKENLSKRSSIPHAVIQTISNKKFGNFTYTLLGRDKQNHDKGLFKCKHHPKANISQDLRSHRLGIRPICCVETAFINKDELQTRANDIFGEYRYIVINIIEKSRATVKCSKHKTEYNTDKTSFKNHPYGGCKECSLENKKPSYSMSFLQFKEEALKLHPEYIYTEKINKEHIKSKSGKVIITCKEHGDFNSTYINHIKNKAGYCPDCKSLKSNNEIIIENYLKEHDLEYFYNKEFQDCKRVFKLKFDFYLPNSNLIIEYDGEQHFKHVSKFGSLKKFKISQERDQIKNKFAKSEGINLLRIHYSLKVEEYLSLIEKTLELIKNGETVFQI